MCERNFRTLSHTRFIALYEIKRVANDARTSETAHNSVFTGSSDKYKHNCDERGTAREEIKHRHKPPPYQPCRTTSLRKPVHYKQQPVSSPLSENIIRCQDLQVCIHFWFTFIFIALCDAQFIVMWQFVKHEYLARRLSSSAKVGN